MMPRKEKIETEPPQYSKKIRASLFTHEPLIEFNFTVKDHFEEKFVKSVIQDRRKENNLEEVGEKSDINGSKTSTSSKSAAHTSTTTTNINDNNTDNGQKQRRIRFAEKERPASAVVGRTRPGPSVLKTPWERKLQGRPSSSGRNSHNRGKQRSPDDTPVEFLLPAPNRQVSPAELTELVELAEDSRLNEELTTDVVGMLSPVQRQNYYSRPAISSRMRMSEYQVHRLNWAQPLRLSDAQGVPVRRWDTTTKPLSASDFHADRIKSLGAHRPRARSSTLRRFHTGKAIVSYNRVVGKPTLPISEMKKSWNRITIPANFCAATKAVKGSRRKYGYGSKVRPNGGYDLGRSLSHSDMKSFDMKKEDQSNSAIKEERKRRSEKRQEQRMHSLKERRRAAAAISRRPRGSIIDSVKVGFFLPSASTGGKISFSDKYKGKRRRRKRK